MHYIPFEDYKRKWIFIHQSMPIDPADRDAIKPMSALRSGQIWHEYVSRESPTADHFSKGDWQVASGAWQQKIPWQGHWEADEDLPEMFTQFFAWEDNHRIYFCYDKSNIVESTWGMFKKYWKNFLFYDDNPLLVGRKRKEVAMFEQSGAVKLGKRP